jgi:hypothetical protein
LFFFTFLSFLLRTWFLPQNLFFGFEQGRDFLKVTDILHGDIVLVGPKTDIDGVFHGALSYYLLLPFFVITQGSPYGVLALFILIHSFSVFLLYFLMKAVWNERSGIFAVILYTFSYPLIIYSRWLSNPNLVVPLVIGIFFCIAYGKITWWLLPLGAILFGILIHLQIVSALLVFVPILLFLRATRYSFRALILPVSLVVLLLLPYGVFEIKYHFTMTKAIISYLQQPHGERVARILTVNPFVDQLTDFLFVEHSLASSLFFLGCILFGFVSIYRKGTKSRFLFWGLLFPPLLFFLIPMIPLRHFYNATPVFFICLLGIIASELWKRHIFLSLIFVSIIVVSNVSIYRARIPENIANFLYHSQRMYLGDELSLIDIAYGEANGRPFSYDYYSIPYWKEEAWKYLFLWYGMGRYGYVPSTNVPGSFYVFIEPDEYQPKYQKDWYETITKRSTLRFRTTSHHLTLEQRLPLP